MMDREGERAEQKDRDREREREMGLMKKKQIDGQTGARKLRWKQ